MKISAELSLYPLTSDYKEPIIAFIQRLREQAGLTVATNGLSTQVTGEYDDVMTALSEAMRPTMEGKNSCSFVIKILNVGIEPGREVVV
ncbi:YkoF family thiamine/hydroxymethylpyrimidine-binding protein [Lewinella sp. IMCC34191]|uniref:YkoF family thiamine/hydroxymethylpyrimidine-binding protein n=1 Tax=Lewinella sp. IMCC34191 TaxID=2259172 RepID=UPI000E248156|nr:YkoF family thiamine/hydroxymethylpyrimidine-binding protein [Lewinella sp. IMCC34191]